MENPDLIEGDILGADDHDDRNAVVDKRQVWPGGIVPYVEDPGLDKTRIFYVLSLLRKKTVSKKLYFYVKKLSTENFTDPAIMTNARFIYKRDTCIRFVPRTTEKDYIRIFPGQGCYSHVGKTGGAQPLSLGMGCGYMGTVIHELAHALGFYHEQNRSDRDDWLIIFWENIKEVYLGDLPMENPDLIEGDILGADDHDDRNAVVDKRQVWPGGVVPYVEDPGLIKTVAPAIMTNARWLYQRDTCIRFVPRTTEKDYIRIFPGQGCYSHVGKTGGAQPVSLGMGCGYMGTVIHELAHALGFYHEQNRSDRDEWLTIFWENIKEDYLGDLPMENPDLIEGDILPVEGSNDRNAIVNTRQLWPGGIVPYVLEPGVISYQTVHKVTWQFALDAFAKNTCVRFVPRTNEKDYVRVFLGQGCYSHVGKTGGAQPLSLGRGCNFMGTVSHELIHALGFYHEQNRSDRDDYIDIHWENIKEGMEDQFMKLKPHQNQLLTPFDYDSIMLYGSYTFSKDRKNKLMTMTGKGNKYLQEVIHKYYVSKSDFLRINMLYNCTEHLKKML